MGSLQEPFTKIPPEGPLPQFTGQIYSHPPRATKSFTELHTNRSVTPSEQPKNQEYKLNERKSNKNFENLEKFEKFEKKNSESAFKTKPQLEKYDTRINITQKVNEDLVKYQSQVEVLQISEKHLREELSVNIIQRKNKKISEQADEIEFLRRENECLKLKLASKDTQKRETLNEFKENKKEFRYFLDKPREDKEFLNIEDISDNLRRLEKLQEDLNKNRFS